MKKLEQNQDQYDMIDIVHLSSAEQVRTGTVPIISSYGIAETLYYTPETYALHLKKILHILETHENYHFVPLEGPVEEESALMVKENHRALLVHTSEPLPSLRSLQPEIVALYREHLLRIAERQGYTGIHRSKIKSKNTGTDTGTSGKLIHSFILNHPKIKPGCRASIMSLAPGTNLLIFHIDDARTLLPAWDGRTDIPVRDDSPSSLKSRLLFGLHALRNHLQPQ